MLWPLARRVFLMHRVDDLSYSEISEIVGIDVMTVEICIFDRSEEHTSELQSLMRISYAVFCLKKKNKNNQKRKLRRVKKYTNKEITSNIMAEVLSKFMPRTSAYYRQ